MTQGSSGFVPPPYPYDRLDRLVDIASKLPGGAVELSIGTPMDPPPQHVVDALSSSGSERGYPSSPGSAELRGAATRWMQRRFGVAVGPAQVAACIGTKEFVGTLPQWLKLRTPERDTILYPAVSYPTYEMGAILGGCRPVAVDLTPEGRIDLDSIRHADAERALALWVNSPGNPTGSCDDLERIAVWGRRHRVPVFSDECYVEFTWDGPPRSILQQGVDGVIAVHSLSKRSNFAGGRLGFYAGDADLVDYLQQLRKHAGFMVPGPVQAAAVVALDDDDHVDEQRATYRRRLGRLGEILGAYIGTPIEQPAGAFYLWFDVGDGWEFAERLARDAGTIVSPGEFYGPTSASFVRVAAVQPDDRIELIAERLGV